MDTHQERLRRARRRLDFRGAWRPEDFPNTRIIAVLPAFCDHAPVNGCIILSRRLDQEHVFVFDEFERVELFSRALPLARLLMLPRV